MINSGTVGVGATGRAPGVGASSQGAGVPKTGAIRLGVGVAVWIRAGVDVGSLNAGVAVGLGRGGKGLNVGGGIAAGGSVGSFAGTYSVAVAVAASVGVEVGVSMTVAVGSTVAGAAIACRPIVTIPRNPRVYSQVEKRKSTAKEPAATFLTSLSRSNRFHRSRKVGMSHSV